MKETEIQEDVRQKEHILVCLSASPSNKRLVETAARMAEAFGGTFTALYVQQKEPDSMDEADKQRLREHIRLAEQSGAMIVTAYGDDVSFQIAEFARISGITKIVIGRSYAAKRRFWEKPALTERLIETAPNVDIHIIPDSSMEKSYKEKKKSLVFPLLPSLWDLIKTFLILTSATGIGLVFWNCKFTEANIITVYLLGVLLTSIFTKNYGCSIISSLISVLVFNFFFTEPRLTFHAYEAGYPVTFAIMLIASLITGSLANKLKNHAKQSAQAAFRTNVLFDTDRLLQKAKDDSEMIRITASQLMKLLDRDIIAYSETNGSLSTGVLFSVNGKTDPKLFFTGKETSVSKWVYENGKRAGASTGQFDRARCLYLAIRTGGKVYGVIGIHLNGRPLDSFENGVLLSILGECALAIENSRNAKAKEEAAVLARNEQLRANLLRTISHDLRTPLTSISGNADNLLANYEMLDKETRTQIFTDIYEDSQWLISLVENLLSVTRLEEGRMHFNMSLELVSEVIEEALRHTKRKVARHELSVEQTDDLMMARMDAKLIVQVLVNLVENAVKYTPAGSLICLKAKKRGRTAVISVTDNGPGIPDEQKPHIFEMFFTGNSKIADSRRSLGLGLSLCRSIIHAHGGELDLTDVLPHGCNFTFTLPLGEVDIHE